MKIFGIPVEIDFRAPDLEELDAKRERYEELRSRVEDDTRPWWKRW